MTDRDAFMARIVAEPEDLDTRLVFADYLDDQGDHDRAAFIRLQIDLHPDPACGECKGTGVLPLHLPCPCTRYGARGGKGGAAFDVLGRRVYALWKLVWPTLVRDLPLTDEAPADHPFLVHCGLGTRQATYVASNGFIETVHTTHDAFVDRDCDACQGRGMTYLLPTPESGGSRIATPITCSVCNGRRTLPGIARTLAKLAPVRHITLTDCHPIETANNVTLPYDSWLLDPTPRLVGLRERRHLHHSLFTFLPARSPTDPIMAAHYPHNAKPSALEALAQAALSLTRYYRDHPNAD